MIDNNDIDDIGEDVILDEETPDDSVENQADGSALVVIGNKPVNSTKHFDNIVAEVDQVALKNTVTKLLEAIGQDIEDRKERDKQYEEGIKRTGLGNDAPGGATFAGATKTVHPMLSQGCIDFCARAMKELWPSGGPAKTKIEGKTTKEVIEKAKRQSDFLNWQLTEQMPEARPDVEKLLSQVPLGGAQYLKIYHNMAKKRPCFEFIPIDDVFLPSLASSFLSAERRTHQQTVSRDEFQRRVKSGMYIEIMLTDPETPDQTKAKTANDKVEGVKPSATNLDGNRLLYEVTVSLDIESEGDDETMRPYILTIDKTTEKAVGLYRNWEEADTTMAEMMWMVEWPFIPWRGAYPIGLIHLIGGLSGAATGAVRAILDAALIQNAQTLLKLKSGVKGETVNLQLSQINEIDAGPVDDIRKLMMAVPYNPPSPVLFQMLGFLVDAGNGVVQTSFEKLSDMRGDAPVGTTMALIEQGLVVFSAIHSRMHSAMGQTLKILCRVNRMYFQKPAAYAGEILAEDFAEPMNVIPVSDPNIFSEVQRFARVQAIMARADAKPQLYDSREVEEMFLRQIKADPDEVLVKKESPENMDPASENVAMVMGSPVFVLPPQDHVGHLLVHCPFAMSPAFGNPVMLQTMGVPMVGHLRDHILQYYLKETHEGVRIATNQKLIAADNAHQQAEAIVRVQAEAETIMEPFVKVLHAMAQKVQDMMTPPAGQNPLLQKAAMDAQSRTETEKLRDARERELEQERQSNENLRSANKIASDERRNEQDNATAKAIVAAEIMSDEHSNLRTGTGINPSP